MQKFCISKHRARKSVPNVRKRVCNVYTFQLSFHFALHFGGWVGSLLEEGLKTMKQKCIINYYTRYSELLIFIVFKIFLNVLKLLINRV